MPDTIQTSPSQVQIAARVMSEKKSIPPTRIFARQGFFSGSESTSVTYGPLSLLRTPFVSIDSVQRGAPPFVRLVRSAGLGDALTRAANASFFAAPPPAIRIFSGSCG